MLHVYFHIERMEAHLNHNCDSLLIRTKEYKKALDNVKLNV